MIDFCNMVHRIGIQTHVCHKAKGHIGDHLCGASDCDITWPTEHTTKEENEVNTLKQKITRAVQVNSGMDWDDITCLVSSIMSAIDRHEQEQNLVQYLANDLQLISGSTQEVALRQARSLLDDTKIQIVWAGPNTSA